jgi:threonyl-tRNA synthetase
MEKKSKIYNIRHSLAHILAYAILKIDPEAKLGIGPVIENGFFYDFILKKTINELEKVEELMREIIRQKLDFKGKKITFQEAKKIFKDQPFKLELLEDLKKYGTTDFNEILKIKNKEKKPKKVEKVTIYQVGEFIDLCRGGHVKNTKEIPIDAFKLVSISGAYWRGNEKNPQMTRIYGLAFLNKKELEDYLEKIKEAKERDHRKLGEELEIFKIIDEIGPGLPLFLPKGAILRRIVENFITELQEKFGYEPIWIPHITKRKLYEISGHIEKYDALFPPLKLEDEEYYLKPMNCPHFMMLYKSHTRSYKDLPIRWTCTTTVYRYEKSGELSGLTRVRALTQDDCHIFLREDQIEEEIDLILKMIKIVYKTFGFNEFWARVSVHDPSMKEKYIGEPKVWRKAESILKKLVKSHNLKYKIGIGEAAFYGPKIDFMFKDVLKREWQLSTVQLDMNLPKRFNLTYIDKDGKEKNPIVIHRAILGSTERFLGILIEHYGGNFPFWLSPIQIAILPISENHLDYAKKLFEILKEKKFRIKIFEPKETVSKRIFLAEKEKIPEILVVGDKEKKEGTVSLREKGKKEIKEMKLDDLIDYFLNLIPKF